MLTLQDIARLKEQVSPEEKINALLGKKTQEAIDKATTEAVMKCKNKVQTVLKSNVSTEPDEDIRNALKLLGYEDVSVTSDFPGYCETYKGTTTIKFKIP